MNNYGRNGTNGHGTDAVPNLRPRDPEPFHNQDPRADDELLVIQRILIQLGRLAGPVDRRRVLEYLIRRENEERAA